MYVFKVRLKSYFCLKVRKMAMEELTKVDRPTIEFSKEISAAAKDLVLKMLAEDSEERISLEDVASHPWLKETSSWWNKLKL
jgi:serine/threonine protein kinase